MPHLRQRLVIAGIALVLALVSVILAVQGLIAAGVLGFVAMVVYVSWATSVAQRTEAAVVSPPGSPTLRPAVAPPDGHIRFTVVVEHPEPARVAAAWADLCRPGRETSEEFRRLFHDFTVLEGNRFRFRRGDPRATAILLKDVLRAATGSEVRTSLEPAAERTPIWS